MKNPLIIYNHTEYKNIPSTLYNKEKYRLQVELLKMQEWMIKEKKKIAIVLEGRDAAGKVEEDRYEGFFSYNFPISNNIRSELALNYEWSEISQSGDVTLSREFQYWKPRIDIKWDYKKNRQIRP